MGHNQRKGHSPNRHTKTRRSDKTKARQNGQRNSPSSQGLHCHQAQTDGQLKTANSQNRSKKNTKRSAKHAAHYSIVLLSSLGFPTPNGFSATSTVGWVSTDPGSELMTIKLLATLSARSSAVSIKLLLDRASCGRKDVDDVRTFSRLGLRPFRNCKRASEGPDELVSLYKPTVQLEDTTSQQHKERQTATRTAADWSRTF
jgi:hypothetical protein